MSFEFYNSFNVSLKAYNAVEEALRECKSTLNEIDLLREYNQLRVIKAFQDAKLSSADFQMNTGYGYSDHSREAIESIFASLFCAEKALVRVQFSSGTQVLSTMLKGILRPYDEFLIVTGDVYDTLQPTIGKEQTKDQASLKDFLISYDQIELLDDGQVDFASIEKALQQKPNYKLIYIQKSRGYSTRPALTNKTIEKIARLAKKYNPKTIIALDNCYGEFVERTEPLALGVDIMAGSLIKNPGAGFAPGGGYIAGKADLVELCAQQMTAAKVGSEIGPNLGFSKSIAQGVYMAPQVVSNALKLAVLTSTLFKNLGYEVAPLPDEVRADIVQTITFHHPDLLIKFCETIQEVSPIDSQYRPVPAPMPGYECDIIMASGSFTQGSSIELSADGPLRSPYTAFFQGGLNFESGKLACMVTLDKLWQEA